jgi:hypothetical protein
MPEVTAKWGFLERDNTQNMEDLVEAGLHPQSFADDGDQDVNRDCDPDLGIDGVLAGAEKGLDAQVLFDSFEEQFHLPALFVDLCDGERGKGKVVGQKLQPLARFWHRNR